MIIEITSWELLIIFLFLFLLKIVPQIVTMIINKGEFLKEAKKLTESIDNLKKTPQKESIDENFYG